jgi:exopolysaccharide transport family protein
VVDKLHLVEDPEFKPNGWSLLHLINPMTYVAPHVADSLSPDQKQEYQREKVIDALEDDLSVSQVQLSTSLSIEFSSHDPIKAAHIANEIAQAYVEDQMNAKLEATQQATQWIAARLGKLAQDARVAEAALQKYKTDNHLTDVATQSGAGTISVLDQQIGAATTQLMQAQMDRAQTEATLSRVRSMVNSGHAAEVSQVVSSPLISQLRQQQAELVQKQAELSARYGAEHPKMLDLMAEQRDLSTKINEEIQRVVGTAANDVAVASAREAALRSSLKQLEGQSSEQGQARVQERELQANAVSTRALYDSFVDRMKQTEQEQTLQLPDSRIISGATIPEQASFPPMKIVLGASLPISLLFGLFTCLLLERLDHGFRTASRVEESLGLPVLATLPETSASRGIARSRGQGSEANAANEVIDKPLSSFAEAIRGLQMGLSLWNVDQAPKIVVVTSALPGEGKTTTAASLARHAAKAGNRVLLIDGDLRRPGVQQTLAVDSASSDLIDVLQGTCRVEDAVVRDSRSALEILPVTKHVKNAPDLLDSQALKRLLAQLRGTYSFIVIDSAPIMPVNDTKILARLADAVVFVVRWETTPRNASMDAVKLLREQRAPLAGAVLSRADVRRLHYYSFGYGDYHYAYSKYYEA